MDPSGNRLGAGEQTSYRRDSKKRCGGNKLEPKSGERYHDGLTLDFEPGSLGLGSRWSGVYSQALHQSMERSESKFGCVNPICVLETLCQLHSNAVYGELLEDLIPTFDRVFPN